MNAVANEPGRSVLACWTDGAGVPVVFLHPTPLDHDYWRPVVAQLGEVRAIVPDLRGHGASSLKAGLSGGLPVGGFDLAPDAPVLSMAQYARDVLELLDSLGVNEAVFAGCSIGGYVMLELWRQAPERMRGLAFVCSKPQADGAAARAKRAETIARARAEGVDGLFDGMVLALTGATSRAQRPELAAELRARMTLTSEAEVAVQAGLATRPDSMETVGTIAVPVLAIAGGEDTAIAPGDMEAFRGAPGGCTWKLLPQAGHFAAYEQPEQVSGLIGAWLGQFRR